MILSAPFGGETPGIARPKGATFSAPAGRNVPVRGKRSVTPGAA